MTSHASGLALYDRTARRGSAQVISHYSTSFGLASRLCSRSVRTHVADVYAIVRIADEIVDGPAEEAGLSPVEQRALLDALEADTEHAIACGYSSNLIVHAFAQTAARPRTRRLRRRRAARVRPRLGRGSRTHVPARFQQGFAR
jgi:phytoene synthase